MRARNGQISYLVCQVLAIGFNLSAQSYQGKNGWTLNKPFEQDVFIENRNGQFNLKEFRNEKILLKARLNGADFYITNKGIIYQYGSTRIDSKTKRDEKAHDKETPIVKKSFYEELYWKGSDSSASIEALDKASFYYTFSPDKKHTIVSNAYKRVVFHNLYNGTDLEYSFLPDKKGIAFKFIQQNGSKAAFTSGLQHIRQSFEPDSAHSIHVAYNNLHSTSVQSGYFWWKAPGFPNYDAAYDLWYDLKRNIYVYGGTSPYQLMKVDSTGAIQWVYMTNFTGTFGEDYYGGFVTDKTTGISYVGEALDDSLGPEIDKISTSGAFINSINISRKMSELWRMDLNYSTRQILLAGGGTDSNFQAGVIDTSLAGLNLVNVLGTKQNKHDMVFLASDKAQPFCYMATSTSNDLLLNDNLGNLLLKCPLPALSPTLYMDFDRFGLYEILSNNYVNSPLMGSAAANGINGIAIDCSTIYMWNGSTLVTANKDTGDVLQVSNLNTTTYGLYYQELVNFGGIDLDFCGNIYLGDYDSIIVLDTNLRYQHTLEVLPFDYYVYDVRFALGYKVYSCGYDFISSYTLPQFRPSFTKTSSPACSGCNGTAHVSVSACKKVSSGEYAWSNGGTGRFQANLCAGTYTVTVNIDCNNAISDTIVIPPSSNPGVNIPGTDVREVSCFNSDNGYAFAIANGGTPPYTYQWYPVGSSSDTATNLTAGTYTFMVTDIHGCAGIDTVTIVQPAALVVSASSSAAIHTDQSSTLTAAASGGTPPYTYTWNDSTFTGSPITVSPGSTTTYTVLVTDKDGCTATATVTVDWLCGDVFIPDAFSPIGGFGSAQPPHSGSEPNNVFYVRGDCISIMDFIVFDRWGNKVFESNSLQNGWDGNYKGQPMNTGTYMWYLKATLKDGSQIDRKGNVALVR